MNQSEHVSEKLTFAPQEQVWAMVFAYLVSVLYIEITTYFFLEGSQHRPGLIFLAVSVVVCALAVSPYVVLNLGGKVQAFAVKALAINSQVGQVGRDRTQTKIRPEDLPIWVGRAVVFGFAIFMIVQLGLVTQYTGGTLESPYAQLLIATALLAPYVANNWLPAFFTWILSVASYVTFGFVQTPVYLPPPPFPGALVAATVGLTSLVAVVVAVSIKRAQQERLDREESDVDVAF